jgi:hypothetical protein
MNSDEPTLNEMWWPSSAALDDLVVEDFEEGFTLSAPDGTVCAEWLNFWNQSEEHKQIFSKAFEEMLRVYLDTLKDENGQSKNQPDGQESDSGKTENERSGVFS